MITTVQFRQYFAAFADETRFPDGRILPWLTAADTALAQSVWGDLWPIGQALYAAHWLALDAKDEQTVAAGGSPGQQSGILTNKSVGGMSAGYDLASVTLADGGFWNLTTYGTRLLYFARLVGMGGRQSGGPDITLGPTFGPAWPGVIYPR